MCEKTTIYYASQKQLDDLADEIDEWLGGCAICNFDEETGELYLMRYGVKQFSIIFEISKSIKIKI